MALSTARIHRVRGRPPLLAAGITSLIHSHSSSVRSLGYIFSFIYPFYTTHEDFSDRLLRTAAPDTPPHLRVATDMHGHRQTVRLWRTRYLQHGLAGLQEAPRPGRPRRLSPLGAP